MFVSWGTVFRKFRRLNSDAIRGSLLHKRDVVDEYCLSQHVLRSIYHASLDTDISRTTGKPERPRERSESSRFNTSPIRRILRVGERDNIGSLSRRLSRGITPYLHLYRTSQSFLPYYLQRGQHCHSPSLVIRLQGRLTGAFLLG